MFDNRKQRVPELFISKIEIDKVVDGFLKLKKVINFSDIAEIKSALQKQKEIRRNCEMFCHMKKVEKDGPGAPAGGTVGRYIDTEAIAA